MKIYLELTPSEYRTLRLAVASFRAPEVCPVCKDEYGPEVVRVVEGKVIKSWGGSGSSPTKTLLESVFFRGDLQLEVAEYEGT